MPIAKPTKFSMSEPKHEEPVQEKPEVQATPVVQKSATITIQNMFGPMWHTDLNRWIDGPTQFDKMDNWIKSQIKAGKLQIV